MLALVKAWWPTAAGVAGIVSLVFSGGVTFGRSNVETELDAHTGPVHMQLDKRMDDLVRSNERLVAVNEKLLTELKEQNRITRGFLPPIGHGE